MAEVAEVDQEAAAHLYQAATPAIVAIRAVPENGPRPVVVASAEEADEAWRSLPMGKAHPVTEVIAILDVGSSVDVLFRNRFLNPRGVYIDVGMRQQLAQVLEVVVRDARPLIELETRVANREFEEAIAAGRAKVLDITVRDGLVNMGAARKRGADMVSVRGGVVYGALRSEMEFTGRVLEIENAMKLDIVSAIALWFRGAGALTDDEGTQIVRWAAERLLR